MRLSPQPVQAYLSRGLFLGAIVSVCFLVVSPPPVTIVPLAVFVLCELASIVLGFKFWSTRAARVGAIGSITFGMLVIAVSITLAVMLFNKREMLKERTIQLERSVENLGRSMEE